jgi:TonB family protein
MKQIAALALILFLICTLSLAQESKKIALGKPFRTEPIELPLKQDAKESDATNFNYGVNELKTRSYESSLRTFNNYLATNPEDYNAYYNRGLVYYYLEDIDHACMDWKYAAYFETYYAMKNYKSVCDESFDALAFRNDGMIVQTPVYDEKFEANKVESLPSFPGGQAELNKFIRKNLNISRSMRSQFLKERIIVRFKVEKDSTVSSPLVVGEEGSALSKEAIRVASKMPKWIPATRNGIRVVSEMYYPIINGKDTIRHTHSIFREGVRLLDQLDFNGALEYFTKVISINEDDDDAHFNRGVCYLKLGDTAKACQDWNLRSLRCQISVVNLLNKYCGTQISLDKILTIKESGQAIYTSVEKMPTFEGGEKAMLDFVMRNIKYPENAKQKYISGRVYISFIVDKDGYVRDAYVLRGIGGGCDEEALRVIKSMPAWSPGYLNGRPVNVQYYVPINFAL